MSWRIKYAACSVQGSARKKNQGNLLCHEFFLPEDHTGTDGIWYEEIDSLPALFCVFDGLGGEMKGEEASFFACESIRNQFIGRGIQRQKLGSERYVREVCREADRRIQQYTGAKYQSGSTVAGILFARFDLITLLFYIYAEEVEPDWPVERYLQYIDKINDLLRQSSMMGIYPVNPYESFVLMCLVTEGPLDVYAEVLEKSFE